MNKLRLSLLLVLGLYSATAFAQAGNDSLPEWEKLTPQQRETLIAPIRERWNTIPAEQRVRMLQHAQRWQQLSPEQRKQARHGMHRFEQMSPEKRHEARALFFKMRGMSEVERKQLVAQWKGMTPEQRKAWIERNAPAPGNVQPPAPPRRD